MEYFIECLKSNSSLKRIINKSWTKNRDLDKLIKRSKSNPNLMKPEKKEEIEDYEHAQKISQKIEYLTKCNQLWNSKTHKNCSFSFHQAVHTFLLCMKRNQKQTGLKIPKFVVFEILKFIDRKSFLSLDFPDDKTNRNRKRKRNSK
jgi:hypothetical protein